MISRLKHISIECIPCSDFCGVSFYGQTVKDAHKKGFSKPPKLLWRLEYSASINNGDITLSYRSFLIITVYAPGTLNLKCTV